MTRSPSLAPARDVPPAANREQQNGGCPIHPAATRSPAREPAARSPDDLPRFLAARSSPPLVGRQGRSSSRLTPLRALRLDPVLPATTTAAMRKRGRSRKPAPTQAPPHITAAFHISTDRFQLTRTAASSRTNQVLSSWTSISFSG